jgi:Rrf2 family protein
VRAGLVESEAGPEGGYRLTSDPGDVSLLAVIEAVEGPLRSEECVLRGGPCHWENSCAIHEPWAGAQDAMRRRLEETTFAELVAADADLERGSVPADQPASPPGSSPPCLAAVPPP